MAITRLFEPIKILGREIKTTNKNGKAFIDIPKQWQKIFNEKLLSNIPDKLNDDIYAIYTKFENEGINNEGVYSFIIGYPVSSFEKISEKFVAITIPASKYQVFEVEKGKPEKVGDKWQEIWVNEFDKKRTFLLEFERYSSDGSINIFVGVQ